jgi:hypothetical protein
VLQRGSIVVGVVNNNNGNPVGGPLLVINPMGQLNGTITAGINGPWGLAIADHFSAVSLFVSNVLDGTVTRINVIVNGDSTLGAPSATTIAQNYKHKTDPTAFVLGPAGLAHEAATDTLYVASEVDNAIYKVTNASKRTAAANKGTLFSSDKHLRGPVGLTLAPNGHVIASNSDAVNGKLAHPSEIVEFTHDGHFVGEYNVNEAQGAAFGVAVGAFNATDAFNSETINFAAVNDVSNNMSVYALPIKQNQ